MLADVAIAATLYASALLARLAVSAGVSYPINEGSAYYVAVARNLAEGRGLVTDALWSFATPPLAVPRPAFEFWQPMASFISAGPMTLLGSSAFFSAQLGHAAFGALVAPLCWAVARQAATALQLPAARARTVALGSGVTAVVLGPFLMAVAIPDSTTPFLVLGLICCLLVPPVLTGSRLAALTLGATLGLTYLSRLEAVYIALAILLLGGLRWRTIVPVVAGGLAVVVPWLVRNVLAFGTPFPGQALEAVFFTRNEDLFAYLDRPTAAQFVGQGPAVLLENLGKALSHNLVDVLIVPAAPVAIGGLIAGVWLMRKAAVRRTALGALLLSGGLSFLAVTLLFPVATLWGTFAHAAGPLLAGLTVAAVIGADALVARLRELRRWPRSNSWLAPLAVVALTLPLTFLLVAPLPRLAAELHQRHAALAQALSVQPDLEEPLISDHPVWLTDATGRSAIALPDESLDALVQLAHHMHAPMVVVMEDRGRYPAELRSAAGAACFEERDLGLQAPAGSGLFVLRADCEP